MFKFQLDQVVYYFRNNKVHSAPIISRSCIENLHDDWASNPEQKELFTPFGKACIQYATCHGVLVEKELFSSKEELLASL